MNYATRTIAARVAELGFTTRLPADWVSHDLPAETAEFSDPTRFFPLAIVTAPHAAIVFAFAARPAYDDGTLHDWAWFHLNHNQLKPRTVGPERVAGVPAVVGEATQASELGTMIVRFAFLEDGGRLINMSLTAPEDLADAVRDAWFTMLQSFTLETPKGSRFSAESAAPAPQPASPSAETDTPSSGAGRKRAPDDPVFFADFALADTAASLDPEATINANLRDRGVGLVPRVVASDDAARRATLAAGAVMALFDVPYGWTVIDDGKRTLVLDPRGKVQINLSLIPREGRANGGVLDDIEATARQEHPAPEFVRLSVGKIDALGVRAIADGAQPIEQYHFLYPFRDDALVLRARITSTPELAVDACNLGELIVNSFRFLPEEMQAAGPAEADPTPAADTHEQAWWRQALALEAANRLDDAEKIIRDGCRHLGFAQATAEMYQLRMLRLKALGDAAGALAAFKQSSAFIGLYAGLATSGGEGAALSVERDAFRAQLVASYGSDPEAGGG